ncbi:MAG: 2-hydroxyacyl-CoA dehydratase, partial [Oscillospiraceae bacterium]|nr:2-hydroxyacyl-CoA dehydratase [Oscillospiraceae bacterium]
MRDLKHLIFFENLLDNADNELVEQAKADGGLAIGYTCFHIPEVILNVDKCFSVRLRAPRTGSIDIATFYMSNYTCEFARSLVERGIEGGFNFLDGLAGVDACSMMNRFYEHFELLKMNEKPNFFVTHTDMPYKVEDYSVRHYVKQMRVRLLDVMEKNYGVDTSDEALRRAVEEHNEVCRILTEIGEMRKADNPVITGYEYHVLNLVSYTCPKKLILPYLRETLSELKKRKPDPKPWYRARVAIVGSEIDDPSLTKMLEDCGAFVVADRYCYGSTPGREEIKLNDDEPVLDQICRHYMEVSECARYISDEKVQQRRDTAE